MRTTSVLSLLFLILGHICKPFHEPFLYSSLTIRLSLTVLPAFAVPQEYGMANKNIDLVRHILQKLSHMPHDVDLDIL